MSSRQMRRLQQLVKSATGADADDEESSEDVPTTMMREPSGNRRRQKGKHREHEQTITTPIQHDDVVEKRESRDNSKGTASSSPTTAIAPKAPAPRRKPNKSKKSVEDDEDALLDAVLRERQAYVDAATGTIASSSSDLLALVLLCDTNRLNTRLERIRNFGADAVEDIGDGSAPYQRADGRPRDTGSQSLFPEHHQHLKFRPSALASANRYRWPPYDSQGIYLSVAKTDQQQDTVTEENAPVPIQYYLNTDAAAFRRSEEALQLCIARFGGLQDLIDCLSYHGTYHISTLLQTSATLDLTGNSIKSQELVDVALYQVGLLLANIPLSATWRSRLLPFAFTSNQLIFNTLRRGVHVALRRGCTRTAWEMCKFLLSLDPSDPYGMLLLIDYAALRCRRWVWLLEVFCALMKPEEHTDPMEQLLGAKLALLPGIAFSAALSKHFMERECTQKSEGDKGSKVIREATAEQLEAIEAMPSAKELLAEAMLRFPEAAVCLVDGVLLSSKPHTPVDPNWSALVVGAASRQHADLQAHAREHLADLFCARQLDMWKPPEVTQFVRDVVCASDSDSILALVAQRGHSIGTWAQSSAVGDVESVYGALTKEDILGNTAAPIPAELLNPAENAGEVEDLNRRVEEFLRDRELVPMEADALLRFRALYRDEDEPPGVTSDVELLQYYQARFESEGNVQQLAEEGSAVSLFLRSLLPWNNTRDMALQAVLRQRGIEDPVTIRNRERRDDDARAWSEDEDEAAAEWESLHSESSNE